MKRIMLLFTVATMMAMMSLAVGAGPALAQDLDPFQAVFGDEEDGNGDDVRVLFVDEDEDVDCDEEVDNVVICVVEDDEDDDDDDGLIGVLFDRRDDHHDFFRRHDDHHDWFRD